MRRGPTRRNLDAPDNEVEGRTVMENIALWATIWIACGVATVVAAALATRSRRWLYFGRGAVGVLFTLGGALVHVVNLAAGNDYAEFADPAHFAWVTDTWRAVVPDNAVALIALLAVFEATVGLLVLSGGRKTQLGYAGVLAFYSALWLFGWFETVWVLAMVPAMLLLLRAERRSQAPVAGDAPVEKRRLTSVGV
jgi:hypothetical protein